MNDAAVRSPAGTAPTALLPEEQAWLGLPSVLPASTQLQLVRMFREQHLPDNDERAELIAHLREAIALTPQVPELRVMLGIVLCLTPQAPGGSEELREAARDARYNFDARLKLGGFAYAPAHLRSGRGTNPYRPGTGNRYAAV